MININNKDFNQVISIKNKMKHQGLMKEVKKIFLGSGKIGRRSIVYAEFYSGNRERRLSCSSRLLLTQASAWV